MHPQHNENCDMTFRYEERGKRAFYCWTHNQWAYIFAAKAVYQYNPHFSDKYLPSEEEADA